jgi:catechol 2,3-dioxygenase-like lactoylglutathione lyase family enzyme
MLANASIVGFVPVSSFAAAEAFYSGLLGLTVLDRDNPFALVLAAADGAMVRCALAPDGVRPQMGTILGWQVSDIHATVAQLIAAGVEPIRYPFFEQEADGVWNAPGGDKVVWFPDPDGNVLSLSQHVSVVPKA